ncbi:MAG: type II toxin-antitoxin system VapC family toxin [Betaproteobacteria bacterium]
MSGIKYLLDTNFILGLLKSQPVVLKEIALRILSIGVCAYSAITRIELLGFPDISRDEESLIRQKLERLTYLPLSRAIEDVAISLRQTRKIKLPDAMIAATALCAGIELLTLDKHFQSVARKSEN